MKNKTQNTDLKDKDNRKCLEYKKESKPILNNSNDFFAQYKDPRWQKKRLQVMERDGFMCRSCQDTGTTLNVHHAVPYRKDTKPWEYEDDELITLCEDCHKKISEIVKDCTSIILGRCWCIDSAMETYRIIERIDGMNPWQLLSVWKLIDILIKF